ncbi:hypothetical protein GYMLUDRAFT_398519 [Collybiopsis luxurians FD-317 M1]|nr:hypothetical protein GYMLUDRAFT_398519 [Collybiopsis luxurians FD-317 M1]
MHLITSGIVIIVSSVLYGIYIMITVLSMHSLLRHQDRKVSQSHKLLLTIIIIMFIVHSGHVAETAIQFVDNLRRSGNEKVDAKVDLQAQLVEAVLVRMNYLLSDFVVVWRAWSLSAHKLRLKSRYVLSICLFVSFVVVMVDGGFTLAVLSRQHGKGHPLPFGVGSIGGGPYRVGKSIPMPLCLFITNIVATGYIGMAFREFLCATKGYLEPSKRIINIRQTLYFMFESGLLYSVIWIVILFDIIVWFPPDATIALGMITPQITAIYPALIILLIAMQSSIGDETNRDIPTRSAAIFQANRPNTLLTTQLQDTFDGRISEVVSSEQSSSS